MAGAAIALLAAFVVGCPSLSDLATNTMDGAVSGHEGDDSGDSYISYIDTVDGALGGDGTIDAADGPVDVITVDVSDTCPTEHADDLHGIFVSSSGTTASNCGSKTQPCSTIQLGIDRAKIVLGTTRVYVDSGTYHEVIKLIGGITVQGGWDNVGGVWHRQCTKTRVASVTIAGEGGYGVKAESIGSPTTLDTLSIAVANTASAGQSLYGIYAVGASTALNLVDVSVAVGNGGTGTTGSTGASGQNRAARCSGAGGATGTIGGTGTSGVLGTFGPTGYTASGAAGTGSVGGAGFGTVGGGGSSNTGCVDVCGPFTGLCSSLNTTYMTVTAQQGSGGCGGEGGVGGGGGGGGGSAVAVFAWDAHVNITRGAAYAGNGGTGGAGGAGGGGALGSVGTKGSDTSCVTYCVLGPSECQKTGGLTTISGGAAGARGGTGGQGGQGGGGTGGSSYAIFQGPSGAVTVSGTALTHGLAGAGSGAAQSGNAGDKGP